MPVHFTKMHGLGNDFVVINAITQSINFTTLPISALAHRHTGIGFDQLLVIGPSTRAAFSCRIFNADGSEAEQCGNGLRCVARFMKDNGYILKNTFVIETKAGLFDITIDNADAIRVSVGIPTAINRQSDITVLSLGNPHAIVEVDTLKNFPIHAEAKRIAAFFPEGINVGFMEIINRQRIRLRTVERGVGLTLACGSNACAAVVAGIVNGVVDSTVNVELALGNLSVEWEGKEKPVVLTGPAVFVFEGTL